jgi:hypothetical protein
MLYALSGRIGLSLGFFQLRFFFESGLELAFDTTDASSAPCLITSNVSSGTFKFIVMMNGVLLRGVRFADSTFYVVLCWTVLFSLLLADRLYNLLSIFEKMSSLDFVPNVSCWSSGLLRCIAVANLLPIKKRSE